MCRPFLHSCIAAFTATLMFSTCVNAEALPIYIGTGGDGIYLSKFDSESGKLSPPVRAAATPRPSFVWIHKPTDTLYSVGRANGKKQGIIAAWAIDPSGELKQRSQHDVGGVGPCFVAVAPDGKYAAVANYGSGSVSLFPVADDGSVQPASATIQHVGSSVNPQRQSGPHAHSSRFDPSGQRVAAADLGTDKVYLYDIGDDGSLMTSQPPMISVPPGSGPRHFVFSPDGKYILILGELSGTITTARYAPPKIDVIETVSTMDVGSPQDAACASAEILFHPNRKWVYCTNRGPNQIAVFDFGATTGKLSRTSAVNCGGEHPRNFRISPDGKYLLCANKNSNNIVVFAIDQTNGQLAKTDVDIAIDQPMCLKFLNN